MATSLKDELPFIRSDAALRGDLITTLLYRLKLNRIQIETDMRLNSDVTGAVCRTDSDLRREMFESDRLLICVQRIAEAKTRSEYYVALQEVLGNVIGAEHFVVFEQTFDGGWTLAVRCGVTKEDANQSAHTDEFRSAVRLRDVIASDHGSCSAAPALFVPLLADREVAALLVIFEFLPQQRAVGAGGASKVLEMLRLHGGSILRSMPQNGREA